MLSPDRRDLLLAHLAEHGTARITDLVAVLGVSDVTVRRDVDALELEGKVQRFHGGVTLNRQSSDEAERLRKSAPRLGLLVPDSPYFREVLQGAREAADAAGAKLALALSAYQAEQDLTAIRRHVETGVDALMLVPPPVDHSRQTQFEEELRALRIPVVLVERELGSSSLLDRIDHVVTDHGAGARMAVEHLSRLGHQRIALVVKDMGPTAPQVRAGYEFAVQALGLAADMPVFAVPQLRELGARTREEQVVEVVEALLRHRATAVVAHGDNEALALLQLALHRGIRVPQDLAIVSYDDEVAAFASIPMTAVAPPKRVLGRTAVRMLLDRLQGGNQVPVHHLTLHPTLIVRETCGRLEQARRPGRRL